MQAELLSALGHHLHQLRQKQNLSLDDIAAKTMIPVRLLSAIETGQLEQLPEPVYVRGFLRRYADTLGLNGDEFASAFPTSLQTKANKSFWYSPIQTQLSPVHLYLLYGVLVLGAVAGLSHYLNRSPSPVMSYASPQMAATIVPLASVEPTNSSGTPQPARSPQSAKPVRVALTLKTQSWVRIVADGELVYEGVLQEGTQQSWFANQQVIVRAGNAGGVLVSYNESKPKPMGVAGFVEEAIFGKATLPSSEGRSAGDLQSTENSEEN
jgi:cytoskeletal protein RodZ